MHHRHALPFSLLLTLFAGCATGSRLQDAPARVDEFVTSIENVHIEADRARGTIADGYGRLEILTSGGGDVTQAYARFVQGIDTVEQQATRLREAIEPMEAAAAPVFEQWEADAATIGNERLRERSRMRLMLTQKRYDTLRAAAIGSQRQFAAFVQELRDHATFLAHDLNPSALGEIQEDVKAVGTLARKLDQELDRCLAAARAYVDNSALPSSQGLPASPDRGR